MTDLRRFDSDGLADATTVTTSTAGPDDNVFSAVHGSVTVDTSGPRSPRLFFDQSVQLDTSVHYYALGDKATVGFRFEYEVGGTAGASNTLVVGSTTGGAAAAFRLDLTGGLKLRVRNNAGTQVGADSTTTLSAGTVYRIEGTVTATQVDIWIFPSETSTSALEHMVRSSTYSAVDQLRFGPTVGSGGGFTGGMYFDSIIVNDTGTAPGPWYAAAADPIVHARWPGVAAETAVRAGYIVENATAASLVASANPDLSSPVEGDEMAVSADGWVSVSVDSLTADTLYYCGVKLDGVLSDDGRFTIRTQPVPGTRRSFKALFGSCQNTGSNHVVFDQMASENAAFLIHMGDLHYEDATTEAAWRGAMENSLSTAKVQGLLATTPMTYSWDNHDWGGDNSYAGSPVAAFAPDAIRELDPNSRVESVGLQSTWVWGRVRFILLDTRAYRDPSSDPASPSKTMLGTTQKVWLKSTLTAATEPLIFLCSGIPWRASASDRWGSYNDEWKEIRNWIDARPAIKKRLYALFGDIHAVAADDGLAGHGWGGDAVGGETNIPHACGAAFNSGGVTTTEDWSHGFHGNDSGIGQYGLITVTDEAPDPITVHFEGKKDDGDVLVEMTTAFVSGLARYRLDGGALVQDIRRYVATGSYPKVDTLVETFGVLDDDVWEGWGSGVAIASGKLAINYLQAGPVLQTTTPYDLTESAVYARVVHTAGTSNEPYMMFGDPGGIFVGNQLQFVLNGGLLFLRELVAGVSNDTTVAYDAVSMAWWRIRHAGTDVFWDTSPDGTTWTNRRTKTAAFAVTGGRVKFGAFNFAANQVTAATFDNVNNA